MSTKKINKNTISIIATEDIRGQRAVGGTFAKKLELNVDQLSANLNIFLEQLGEITSKTPDHVGKMQLTEIEVSAEINGKGQFILWGIGSEIGGKGGIKFVFKRSGM